MHFHYSWTRTWIKEPLTLPNVLILYRSTLCKLSWLSYKAVPVNGCTDDPHLLTFWYCVKPQDPLQRSGVIRSLLFLRFLSGFVDFSVEVWVILEKSNWIQKHVYRGWVFRFELRLQDCECDFGTNYGNRVRGFFSNDPLWPGINAYTKHSLMAVWHGFFQERKGKVPH